MPPDPLTAQCKVVDQLGEGEIYVLVTRGEYNCAVFGELFATAVRQRGGAGVLLDGYARDVKALKAMDFPLFYRGRDTRTSKGRCEINECQIPVVMEGVTICPGDYIFGDADGVVIIPKDIVDEVLEKSFQTVKRRIRSGTACYKAPPYRRSTPRSAPSDGKMENHHTIQGEVLRGLPLTFLDAFRRFSPGSTV